MLLDLQSSSKSVAQLKKSIKISTLIKLIIRTEIKVIKC